MKKRTRYRQGRQGECPGSSALEQLLAPLVGVMTTTRDSLLAWIHACGVAALDAVFREQAEAVAGRKGQHQTGRTHHHWGTTPTELTLGGRRIQVQRPRVRGREGGEVTLPAVAAFRGRDPLTARVLEQILLGVSTRGYAASLEAGPVGVPSRATSRSAVSRRLIRGTREQVAAQLNRRLDGLDVVALFGDGVVVAGQTVIVLLGITRDGRKEPLGVSVGSTENAAVCTDLLQDVLARGLPVTGRLLCVIDGGKGLRRALQDVFGDSAVVQRCQVHKRRNLQALLPPGRQAYALAALGRAYRAPSATAARRQLRDLAAWLEQNGHDTAAASLREALEETLTVLTLGLPPRLRRFFATTNAIENLIGTLRHVARNVKRWRNGPMIRRWVALGVLRAAARFRRIKGHGDLAVLATALRPATADEHAA
jgi:putative transposase